MKERLYQEFEKIKKQITEKKDFFKNNLSSERFQSAVSPDKRMNFLFLNDSSDSSEFSDDKARIIFSNAFRKLAYKTQVFFNNFGDYNRTRLTHSLETSEISKTICKFLCLSTELSECISLCHDLGHTPFGHSGEDGLNLALKEFGFESFNHNIQSIKIVTSLEKKYSASSGFNLDSKILSGLLAHNGSVKNQEKFISKKDFDFLCRLCKNHDINPNFQTHLEGQISSISDDIAYTNHDIEDGFRANFLKLEDLVTLPIIGEFLENELKKDLSKKQIMYNLIVYLTNFMILDCIKNFLSKLESLKISSLEQILNLDYQIFNFSDEMKSSRAEIKKFLFRNFYENPELMTQSIKMRNIIRSLFIFYFENPSCLPFEWQEIIQESSEAKKHEIITDFIAGMTDRFAISTYNQIFL
jgi:dGTPase